MFGIWKQRFRCLRIPLRMRLQKSLVVIIATACLHNFAVSNGDFYEIDVPEEDQDQPQQPHQSSQNPTTPGRITRQQIIRNFFNIEKAALDLTRKTLAQLGTFETNLQRFILYFGDFFFIKFNFQVQELHFLLLNCPRVRDLLVYKFYFFLVNHFLGCVYSFSLFAG